MLEQMAKGSVYVALPVKTLPGALYASPRAGFTPDLQLKAPTSVGAPAGLNQAKVNRNGKRLDDR